jgi:hypothetical protein
MADERLTAVVRVDAGADADRDELDQLTQQLSQELLLLDIDSVEPAVAGPPPPGARVVDIAILGTLLVTLARSPELLKGVAGVVQSWLGARQNCSVELQLGSDTLKVSGIGSDEQQRLIQLFIERHAS